MESRTGWVTPLMKPGAVGSVVCVATLERGNETHTNEYISNPTCLAGTVGSKDAASERTGTY